MNLLDKFQQIEEIILNKKTQRSFFEEETFLISDKKTESPKNENEIQLVLNVFDDLVFYLAKTKLNKIDVKVNSNFKAWLLTPVKSENLKDKIKKTFWKIKDLDYGKSSLVLTFSGRIVICEIFLENCTSDKKKMAEVASQIKLAIKHNISMSKTEYTWKNNLDYCLSLNLRIPDQKIEKPIRQREINV